MLGLFFFLSSDQRLGQTHTRSRMAMTVAIRSHVRKPGWAGRWERQILPAFQCVPALGLNLGRPRKASSWVTVSWAEQPL